MIPKYIFLIQFTKRVQFVNAHIHDDDDDVCDMHAGREVFSNLGIDSHSETSIIFIEGAVAALLLLLFGIKLSVKNCTF